MPETFAEELKLTVGDIVDIALSAGANTQSPASVYASPPAVNVSSVTTPEPFALSPENLLCAIYDTSVIDCGLWFGVAKSAVLLSGCFNTPLLFSSFKSK